MTTIHTFTTAQGTTETRKSKSRQYRACLVTTVTEKVVESNRESNRESIAKLQNELVGLKAQLATVEGQIGLSAEEAQVAFKADQDKDWFPKLWDMEKVVGTEMGLTNRAKKQISAEATKRLAAQGILDPYRKDGPYAVVKVSSDIDRIERALEQAIKHQTYLESAIGHQGVLSWHLTVPNAQKALGGRDAEGCRKTGYTVTISTDFEVRETKSRKG